MVGNRGKIAQLERGTPTVVAGIIGKVIQIATSNSDSYALTSSGTVWAWGVGSYGELGNGGTSAYVTRAVQVAFPAGVRIVALPNPMPFDGALAIDSLGRAWGWGLNANGDLCLSGLAELRQLRPSLGLGGQPERATRHRQPRPHPDHPGRRGHPPDPGLLDASNVAGFEQS